jgi:signal transduction histidine kinase
MFRKLLLKLTLLNAGVIAILFCLLIAGAYFVPERDLFRRTEFFLSRLATEINSGYQPPMLHRPHLSRPDLETGRHPARTPADFPAELPPPPPGTPFPPMKDGEFPQPPVIFYAKLDANGNIAATSASVPYSAAELAGLVKDVGQETRSSGKIAFADSTYFYLRAERQDAPGQLLLFQNFDREQEVFRTLMTSLALIGVLCLVASWFGSLFLARRAMAPIQRSWTQQRDFLADASHELRTPLAVIQANLDVVKSNADEPVAEQSVWLDNIETSVKSMAALVNSLLFLARMDSSQHPIQKKPFRLDQAVEKAVGPYKILADAKSVTMTAALASDTEYFGDEQRIQQVLGILLDNALRYTPGGGKIEVMLRRLHRAAYITVSDTGPGIPPEHLPKIFDRFYQVDPARNQGGAGLGLAIAKCIVETHGGTIQAVSQLGKGANFSITLPLSQPHPLK